MNYAKKLYVKTFASLFIAAVMLAFTLVIAAPAYAAEVSPIAAESSASVYP